MIQAWKNKKKILFDKYIYQQNFFVPIRKTRIDKNNNVVIHANEYYEKYFRCTKKLSKYYILWYLYLHFLWNKVDWLSNILLTKITFLTVNDNDNHLKIYNLLFPCVHFFELNCACWVSWMIRGRIFDEKEHIFLFYCWFVRMENLVYYLNWKHRRNDLEAR